MGIVAIHRDSNLFSKLEHEPWSELIHLKSFEEFDEWTDLFAGGATAPSIHLIFIEAQALSEHSHPERLVEHLRFRLGSLDVPILAVAPETFCDLSFLYRAGISDLLRTPLFSEENAARVRSYSSLRQALEKSQERSEELEKISRVDPLTQMHNRRSFDESLEREWRRAHREQFSLALIMIDLDRFKAANDRFGHLVGDQCLQHVARLLKSCIRRPADRVARFGGEEFVALLPSTSLAGAELVAESMRRAVDSIPFRKGTDGLEEIPLSISAGVAAEVPKEIGGALELLERADRAVYQAKANGRNCVIVDGFGAGPSEALHAIKGLEV